MGGRPLPPQRFAFSLDREKRELSREGNEQTFTLYVQSIILLSLVPMPMSIADFDH